MEVVVLLCVGLLVSSWVPLSQGTPLQAGDRSGGDTAAREADVAAGTLVAPGGGGDGGREELVEEVDFEDDEDYGALIGGDVEPNVNSVRHFHEKRGEILIPCFGMWWPVGGSSYYDYVGDYYGDGRKKRRRSRKQKKAAKMKKKKS